MNLRKASQNHQGAWKRFVSFFMVLCMVVTMLPMTQMTAKAASDQVTVKAHFKNTKGWDNVGFYAWLDNDGGTLTGEWPGKVAQANEEHPGYHTYVLTKERNSALNYIFNNNNNGLQTNDLKIEASQFKGNVFEVWVTWNGEKGNETISYKRPEEWGSKNPQLNADGTKATFTYEDSLAKDVAFVFEGSDSKTTMTNDGNGVFSCTVDIPGPGAYKYQLEVDGVRITDPVNLLEEDGMSLLCVPGLVGGTVKVVRGTQSELPKMLTEVMADGTQKQTVVEYSLKDEPTTTAVEPVAVAFAEEPEVEPEVQPEVASGDVLGEALETTVVTPVGDVPEEEPEGDATELEGIFSEKDGKPCVTVPSTYLEDTLELLARANGKSAVVTLSVLNDGGEILKSPEVDGNSVTFRGETAKSVKLFINGEPTVKEFVNNEVTMYVGAGNYAYQFIKADGTAIKDENNILVNADKSRLIVPGLVDAEYQAVKARTFYLPTHLDEYLADGSAQKVPVTYSTDAEGVEIDNTKHAVTVSESYAGKQVQLTASAGDNLKSKVTLDLVTDTNQVTIKLYYDRTDGDYSNSDAWVWPKGKDGASYAIDNKGVATIVVNGRTTTSVGYIINKNGQKDWNGDRFIEIGNIVHGTIECHIKSGIEAAEIVYGDDVVIGTKVSSAKYDEANNVVVVTTSEPIVGDPLYAFAAKKLDGTSLGIASVSADKNVYTIKLAENIGKADLIERIAGYLITYDGYDYNISMPNEYSSEEFENLYTYDGKDLGATWTKDKTTFKLWAPTAKEVKLNLYKSGTKGTDDLIETIAMVKGDKGVWTAEKAGDLNGTYYTYAVTVNGKTNEVCDPYARTTGVNGNRAMVIDLDSTDPEGWDKDVSPNKGMNYTDAVIYELHVRDLSSNPDSGIKNTGKFLGLAETGTRTPSGQLTGLDHLVDLGITHLHILPFYDYGSVDETKLDTPQFNWGYDPVNYNVPEGSYSTDPYNGEVRVKELKQTVQTLHENDINVVMDVVYNHVYAADSFCFNQIVPQYFSRLNEAGGYSNGSGCGNDTASERSMVKKYIVDSVKYWADEYHIDGFRFDLVGLIDTKTINEIVTEVHKTHPDVIFYGEGWSLNTTLSKDGYTLATQVNSTQTPGFAYFSDTMRDGLRGSVFEHEEPGFMVGAVSKPDGTKLDTLIANCMKSVSNWSTNPSQTVNYGSCHDNHTLKDRVDNTAPTATAEDRIKMNNLAAVTYMTSQGIPFIHAGEEILRKKVNADGETEHNSYNLPDSVNMIKWGDLDKAEYQQVNEYYKGLIAFRKNHKGLRLTTAEDVYKYVTTDVVDTNVILYTVDGKNVAGEVADGIVVILNANRVEKEVNFVDYGVEAGEWKVCVNDKKAGIDALETITNGTVKVPSYSAVVLVKGETVDNDSIYSKSTARVAKSIELSSSKMTIVKGKKATLTATVKPATTKDKTVTWTTSDKKIATVDKNGKVTAKKGGKATITAETVNGVKATCEITVAEVTLNATKMPLQVGKSTTALKVKSKSISSDKVKSWKSSNKKVATVSSKGKIKAKKKGTTTITVTMKSGATATCKVTVQAKKVTTKKLTLNKKKATLKKGKTLQLTVTRNPISATEKIKWSSSNKKVATVSSKGKVKAKKKGKATITAKASNGKKVTCKITVK